ncbi:MAG: transposase [Pseudomonadota bacterium]
MKRSRFSEEQIIGILKEHQASATAADLCRKHGVSDATFYKWRSKYGGMEVSGKGVRVFGIDYSCSELRQFHLHLHETEVELRIDLTDLGWIVVYV